MPATRRLAAIVMADVAGYSRLVGADEEGTLAALTALRREFAHPKIEEHHGRIVRTTGDGLLVEFASVVDAVRCAVEVQREMAQRNDPVPLERRIEFRIGINLGDIINDGEDIFGDGVNIAARLEALADAGGICVSRVVRDQVRDKLPVAFEDRGEQQVKNIARPVRVYRVLLDAEARPAAAPPTPEPAALPQPPLPDRPSIAVLPFQNMSGDSEQEYFADGMVEEIITALSRIKWLFVIARNSTFIYKGKAIDIKQVGRELGVRYVLEGSVRKAGGRVRITAQLIEALTGAHLWADRFDGSLEDIFDLQDKVASSVAGVIEPALQAAETVRSADRPTHDLTAYDLYLRAYEIVLSSGKDLPQALRLLDQAIERDPRYAPALALSAVGHLRLCVDGLSKDPPADRRRGADLAHRALKVARDDPSTLANACLALAYFGEDIGAMVGLIDHALALNPSYARGWYVSGVLRWFAGEPDIAIEHVEASMRLSPGARIGMAVSTVGAAHFLSRRFDQALPKLLLAIQENPDYPVSYRYLAACYAHMGRLDEAREIVARLRAITPLVVSSADYLRNLDQRELLMSGLRSAAEETS
jgi:TolB-like protein/class 3 adenylate cyclase